MREEKIARSVSCAFIVLLLAFAPLYLLCGLAFARAVLFYGLACTAIGTAVGLLLGDRHTALQIFASAIPSAALALAVPVNLFIGAAVARYCMMGAGALLAVWAEWLALTPADPSRESSLLLAPLAVLLAVCAVLWLQAHGAGKADPAMWTLLIAISSLWFVAALFLLNRLSLRNAASTGKSQGGIPAGARRSGAAGVVIFAVAVFALAGIGAITKAVGGALKGFILWLVRTYLYLMSLLAPAGPQATPAATASPDSGMPKLSGNSSPFMQLLSNIMIVVFGLGAVALIVYGAYKLFPKLWQKILERIRSLFSTWREEEGYEDRSESLMSLKQALAGAGSGLRKFARRFRRRPRIADFPTNAGRARFLFREYLRGLVSAGRCPPSGATATDIAKAAPALAQAYNRARYAEEEPEDEEIARAKDSLHFN